jgi:Ca2+-binding RTX toxin-like protein
MATFNGTTGNDTLTGGNENDIVNANAGNDTVYAGSGNDTVYLGDGNDKFGDWSSNDSGNDTIHGEGGNDAIIGGAGNDAVYGDAGDDALSGQTGTDALYGGDGMDAFFITNDHEVDNIYGGAGGTDFDQLYFSNYNSSDGVSVTFTGSEGGTYSFGGQTGPAATGTFTEIEAIGGTSYADKFDASASTSSQYLWTGAGNDSVTGGSAADQIAGGTGDDSLNGGSGDDLIWGEDGTDRIAGGAGNDGIDGGAGGDTLDGGTGDDTIQAGSGNDSVYGGDGNDIIDAWEGDDLVYAGAGNDTAHVSTGSDTFYMEGGDDVVIVWDNAGTKTFYGGDGSDQIDFANWQSSTGVTVNINPNGVGSFSHYNGATTGTFTGFEQVSGTDSADSIDASATTTAMTLSGEGGADTLRGGSGGDTLYGGDGNDSLSGGGGTDTLSAGAGDDLLSGGTGDDKITTGAGADTIQIEEIGGNDIVTDFNMTMVNGKTVDQLDVSDLTDAEGGPITWRDVTVTDTLGDGTGDAILTFPNGESVVLQGVRPDQVDSPAEMSAIGIPCFVSDTLIQTPAGPRPVQSLRAGDLVLTDQGPRPVIWSGKRSLLADELAASPELCPVHFATGAIGNDHPLRLSPQHAVPLPRADGTLALVRAKHLAEGGLPGTRIARGARGVTYHHILLDRHALVLAAGAKVESMYPGPHILGLLPTGDRLAIAAAIASHAKGGTGSALIDLSDLSALYGPRIHPLLDRRSALRLVHQARRTGEPATIPATHGLRRSRTS